MIEEIRRRKNGENGILWRWMCKTAMENPRQKVQESLEVMVHGSERRIGGQETLEGLTMRFQPQNVE